MKTVDEITKILASYKSELQKRYKVKEIGIFGSYVKNAQKQTSDIDILVDFEETPTLLKFINLENYLSDLLGIKVDLVMKKALEPNIGKARLMNKEQAKELIKDTFEYPFDKKKFIFFLKNLLKRIIK